MTKKLFFYVIIFVVLCTIFTTTSPEDMGFTTSPANMGFLRGVSSRSFPPVDFLTKVRANSVHILFKRKDVEPEIIRQELTVEQVKAHPAMIDEFISRHDWTGFDAKIAPYIAAGIYIVVQLGSGFDGDLPRFEGGPANPNRLGRENYLGHMFLYVSAVAKRYKDKVKIFCLECELNEAGLATLYGWRSPSFIEPESAWCDFQFLTSLIATMSEAVDLGAPNVLKAASFHTDISQDLDIGRMTGNNIQRMSWIEVIMAWEQYLDIIGLNAYPNYYVADPVYYDDIRDRVMIVKDLFPDKPVVIFETGYPIPRKDDGTSDDAIFPDPVDWTEKKQARYLWHAIWGAAEVADGIFCFNPYGTGCGGAPEGYSEKDLYALAKLGTAFREGDEAALSSLIFELGLGYIQNRFPRVLQGAEGFGVRRPDGSMRPGFYAIKNMYNFIATIEAWGYIEGGINLKPEMSSAPSRVEPISALSQVSALFQNFPNPFNSETWIPYHLSESAKVVIRIYAVSGQLIWTLNLGHKPAGLYIEKSRAAYWDGRNNAGEQTASGIYFYNMRAGDFTATRKMIKIE